MAQTILEPTGKCESFLRRVSWGGIFGGVVVVLITHLMFTLLGVAFGAGSIAPLEDKNPLSGLGAGSAIWLGVSTLLALFAGGWVAARLAAVPDRVESTLHGVVTWGLASLAAVYLITTAATGIVSGAAGVVGKTASLLGQGAGAVAPEIASAVGNELGIDKQDWNEIKKEAGELVSQSGNADPELDRLWQRIEARGGDLEAADKDEIANVLVARTKMSKSEATATVDRWAQNLTQAKAKIAQVRKQAEQKAREIADSTASAVSKAAAWSFVGLMIGLIAAAFGGFFGAPREAHLRFKRRPLEAA